MKINAEIMHNLTTHDIVKIAGLALRLEGPHLRVTREDGKVTHHPLTAVLETVVGLSYQSKMYIVDKCPQSDAAALFGLPAYASKQELYLACSAA